MVVFAVKLLMGCCTKHRPVSALCSSRGRRDEGELKFGVDAHGIVVVVRSVDWRGLFLLLLESVDFRLELLGSLSKL